MASLGNEVAQELVGKTVRAKTFESIEYDREPQDVVGKLSKRHVDTLDYDQHLVEAEDGGHYLVDPETIAPFS